MSNPGLGNGSSRARSGPRHGGRSLSRAVAERERGRYRLNVATATVGFASVLAAGAVITVLPGSTHKTVNYSNSSAGTAPGTSGSSGSGTANTGSGSANSGSSGSASAGSGSSGSGSSGSASSGSASAGSGSASSNTSNSANNSGGLQAPAYTPVQSGGGQIISGGS